MPTPRPHWARKYIGMQHSLGARGPRQVDCWGLLCVVYKNEFKIDLPQFPGIALCSVVAITSAIGESAKKDWIEVKNQFDGCAVGMGLQKVVHHVGIFADADGGKVIHSWEKRNVVADTVDGLRAKGFRTIKFYRHREWPL